MNLYKRSMMKLRHEALRFRVKRAGYVCGLNREPREKKIIVSLTSYPARFPCIEWCLKSLFLQSMKADRIILWLGSDSKEEEIACLRRFEPYGLEIRRDENNNYRSHKKYLYALREFPEDLVITVDDDLIYPRDLIASLYEMHEKYPSSIVARRVHRITWENDRQAKTYTAWEGECESIRTPSFQLLPTTGAGALFPPHALAGDYDRTDLIRQYAFTADDIWLKFMAVMNGTKTVWAPNRMQMPTTINLAQKENLAQINVEQNRNDRCFGDLLALYGLSRKDFSDNDAE